MGEQFGLRLADLWELPLQHLGNSLMVVLTGTLEERLIGGVLDQRMFEALRRVMHGEAAPPRTPTRRL
jgi:hypothetical protein